MSSNQNSDDEVPELLDLNVASNQNSDDEVPELLDLNVESDQSSDDEVPELLDLFVASNQNSDAEVPAPFDLNLATNQNSDAEVPALSDLNDSSNQNSDDEVPELSDLNASSNQNSDDEVPPLVDLNVAKVVVVGEPGCGKTSFIRQYYDRHSPGGIGLDNGATVYNCVLEKPDRQRRVSIFEIPGEDEYPTMERRHHYKDADIIVFMYAIDDPRSYQKLTEKWLIETFDIITVRKLPVVFVGTKIDLQHDQEVIERLAAQNQSLIRLDRSQEMIYRVPNNVFVHECSADNIVLVEFAFGTIFSLILLAKGGIVDPLFGEVSHKAKLYKFYC